MKLKTLLLAAVSTLIFAACSTTEQWSPAQKNAALGGALGAAAGAAVANDDVQGALIGGALGAAIGYYTGCQQQGGCYVGGNKVAERSDLKWDDNARRYYYVDRSNNRTYWEDGTLRG